MLVAASVVVASVLAAVCPELVEGVVVASAFVFWSVCVLFVLCVSVFCTFPSMTVTVLVANAIFIRESWAVQTTE